MNKLTPEQVTGLLVDWGNGNKAALDKLMPLVYDELRRLARYYIRRERAGQTLQTTALVNEAYLRLVDQRNVRWQNRAHFFAIAAQLMRRILVDKARKRYNAKRGGNLRKVSLDGVAVLSGERDADLIALDEALIDLEAMDSRKSKIVELRFFGGLNIEEAAEVLSISPATVQREWSVAKAWLYREISGEHHDEA
jgi:RNA polymerase sigma factor (TIGR02999 family)